MQNIVSGLQKFGINYNTLQYILGVFNYYVLASKGRFKRGLRCKGRVNSAITEMNYRCNYMQVCFFKYKYNVKT